jgi:predicted CoA-substrate-specific enzyme activase
MIVAGVDVGNQTGKAVILRDDRTVLAKAVVTAAEEAAVVAEQALAAALAQAGLQQSDLDIIVATGVGRNGVPFAQRTLTEVSCDAKAAVYLYPSARTVIDIGAEDARGLRCDESGKVLDFVMNDKCASGAGVFIEAMAKALELSLEEMAQRSLQSQNEVDINCTCAVFAESEVVSLIHRQVPREDIARGIHDSIALRSASMLRRIGLHDDLVLVGGAALNVGMVDAVARRTGKKVLVPEDPVTVGALGAALYALEGSAA